jgi:DNA replication and repair protein RecF
MSILTSIEADRLRNLKAVALELPAGMTCIVGRNGQGKTSLLEAAYLLGTGRSFRTRRQEELVAWEGGPLRVAGGVEDRRGVARLAVLVDETGRRLVVGGAEVELEAFIGRLGVVDLTAQRMEVLRGPPVERRRFLDRGVVGLRPSYLRALGEYRRVLGQRNALLREGPGRDAELEAWETSLVRAANEIHRCRREYATRLAAGLGEGCRALFGDAQLTLHYRPSPEAAGHASAGDFSSLYAATLARTRGRDRALGHTSAGPHRDELGVELDGVDLRRFGSAGQLRGAMIALKLSKLALLRKDRGEPPVFLMDDFDTDLDERRAAALAGFLQQGGFQAVVATSKEEMAERLGVTFMKIRMRGGEARAA